MSRTLLEILNRYEAGDEASKILISASDIKIEADKGNKLLRISASFPHIIRMEKLYRIEEEVRRAYALNSVRILPTFPEDEFDIDSCIGDILSETERDGYVAKGFFTKYRYKLNDGNLLIEIPFIKEGVMLLYDAQTPKIIEEVIKNRYSKSISVTLENSEDLQNGRDPSLDKRLEEYDKALAEASKNYRPYSEDQNSRAPTNGGADSAEPTLPRVTRLGDEVTVPERHDDLFIIGNMTFNVSSPEYVMGDAFVFDSVQTISSLTQPKRNVTLLGNVFIYEKETNRTGDKYNLTVSIYDGSSSIEIKCMGILPDDLGDYDKLFKKGNDIAVRGYAKRELRRDRSEGTELLFYLNAGAIISREGRRDTAEEKRVELHLHTVMSNMDALIPPDVAVKQAKKWGHPAVAITDHGNVQGYQDAMLASEKIGMKVIYGIEAYFVNNTSGAVTGEYSRDFNDETIVFDIETTGLSVQNCKITEIGAVRIKDGEVIDRFDTFVDPEEHIPEEITELTSITDEMVAGAPKANEALRMFFDFVGGQDKLLVAHNASFDTGFIRAAAQKYGYEFSNPYLDTLALSRFLNTELKNHKLDTLANLYKLGDFNHHRACDDAEMLANIYICMLRDMHDKEIVSFDKLKTTMAEKSDPLRLPTYHQIILVKNKVGLKNLYKLVSYSYLNYFRKQPRIPKTELDRHREGLIIGSACEAGELFRAIIDNKTEAQIDEIVEYYDYLEIQPICNNRFLIAEGKARDDEDLRNFNRRIVELGEKHNKPVVATCDAHFLNDEDEIYRQIILAGKDFKDADRDIHLYYRTTDEMLKEFEYLGADKAYEVVVKNTNMIADMIDSDIRPFPKGTFTPNIEGSDEDLNRICHERAKSMYGDPLPTIVAERLEKELTSIIKNGFAVLYMIAQKLVWYSESQGYLVGSRGSVGSSFVASMAGISEVNPLPPHYWCPKCAFSDFSNEQGAGSGFDLPDRNCPVCGTKLKNDGHNIPFETFLGFHGDKSPDIDLNFSGEVQGKVHKYTEELFGAENVFRAGTIGTLADKTAYGFIMKYLEEKGISLPRAEVNRLVSNCVGVKRSTGQHPGGIVVVPKEYEIYDFCPVQHPADDPTSNIVTTHFTFEYLHDTLLKLDELGHDIPTKYKWLERFTDTSVMDVPMNDTAVYELFTSTKPLGISPDDINNSTGTFGLPEFGTRFVIKMLEEARPKSFADLLQISGLSHGTDVWNNNAQDLIKEGICTISEVVGCRDSIMNDLIRYGVVKEHAFKIMEMVRKGKGLTPEYEQEMRDANVPDWYIGSCKKIKYMFPKAHAAAYVMSAIRLGWYKVHMPIAFYCAMFTVASDGFDASVALKRPSDIMNVIKDIEGRGREASQKEQSSIPVFQLVNEAKVRGIEFLPVNIEKSDSRVFKPEGNKIRMPFSAVAGIGENAAQNIVDARETAPFMSVEDLQTRAKLTKTVVEVMRQNKILDDLSETDQLSFF